MDINLRFKDPLIVKTDDHTSKAIIHQLCHVVSLLNALDNKIQESTRYIMSQLSDALNAINDATNADAASAAAAAAATETNAVAVRGLRDRIDAMIRDGGTPTAADSALLDNILNTQGSIKASLDATAARLLVIAADPAEPVPTDLPPVVPLD